MFELISGAKHANTWFISLSMPRTRVTNAVSESVSYSHFEVVADNTSTLKYIEEMENADEVKTFRSVEDMLKALGIE